MGSYETVHRWVNHFGSRIAADLRRRRSKPDTIWHLDEVYLKIDGRLVYLWRAVDAEGDARRSGPDQTQDAGGAQRKLLLRKYGFVPDKLVTDDLRSYGAAASDLGLQNAMSAVDGATIERRIRISQHNDGRGRCKGSRAWDPRKDFSQCMQQHKILSTSSVI